MNYGIPTIDRQHIDILGLLPFNFAMSSKEYNKTICYFIDDYQFERLWNRPERYIPILKKYNSMLSPEFSILVEEPKAKSIWNTYRNRWLGKYYQSAGINVIPSVCWSDKSSYDYAFEGILEGSEVAIETHGMGHAFKTDMFYRNYFYCGLEEMIKRINPTKIHVYGIELPFMPNNCMFYKPFYSQIKRPSDIRKATGSNSGR